MMCTTPRRWLSWPMVLTAALTLLAASLTGNESPSPPAGSQKPELPGGPGSSREEELRRLAAESFGQGDYAKALQKYQELRELLRGRDRAENDSAGSLALIEVLHQVGLCHRRMGNHQQRLQCSLEALAVCRQLKGEEDELPNCLQELAWAYMALKQYDNAAIQLQEADSICQRLYPAADYPHGHPVIANVLRTRGELALAKGESAKGSEWLQTSVKMLRHAIDSTAPDASSTSTSKVIDVLRESLSTLSTVTIMRGEYRDAIELFREIDHLLRSHSAINSKHGKLAISDNMRQCAGAHIRLGQFDHALKCLSRALEDVANLDGVMAEERKCVTLMDLATVSLALHDFSQALSHSQHSLELAYKLTPPDVQHNRNMLVPAAHCRYGLVLLESGHIDRARQHLDMCIAMQRELQSARSTSTLRRSLATSLSAMGGLWVRVGEYGRAIDCFQECKSILDEVYTPTHSLPGHPDTAHALYDLGSVYAITGEHRKAVTELNRAAAYWDSVSSKGSSGPKSRIAALTFDQLGNLHRLLGDYDKAAVLFSRSSALLAEMYPKERFPYGHTDIMVSLVRQSRLYRETKQLVAAQTSIERAQAMSDMLYPASLFPLGTLDVSEVLVERSHVLSAQDKHHDSRVALLKALRMRQAIARHLLPGLSDAEARSFVHGTLRIPESLIATTVACDKSFDEVLQVCWNRRCIALDAASNRLAAGLNEPTPDGRDFRMRYILLSRQLGALLRSVQRQGTENQSLLRQIARLAKEKEEMESRMVVASHDGAVARMAVSEPHDLFDRLSPEQAYIEFVVYSSTSERAVSAPMKYGVFVVQTGRPIAFRELGRASEIDAVIDRFRRDVMLCRDTSRSGNDIRSCVWDIVDSCLGDAVQEVFLCLDGALSFVPFAAIPGGTPDTCLVEEYCIVVVPSGSRLVGWMESELSAAVGKKAKALIVGDVDYGEDLAVGSGDQGDVLDSVHGQRRATVFARLPATREEIFEIRHAIGEENCEVLMGDKATLENVCRVLPAVQLAHFATHGFCEVPFGAGVSSGIGAIDVTRSRRENVLGRNPMSLCGIVLAGANRMWRGDEEWGMDDGVLSAETICQLPLQGVNLVVLSSCDTGLGDAVMGEGVYGIHRAFHIAGCRNVIGSLWRVRDDATRVLMGMLYKEMVESGSRPGVALRNVQIKLRARPELVAMKETSRGRVGFEIPDRASRSKSPSVSVFTPPRDWAAFFISGFGQ